METCDILCVFFSPCTQTNVVVFQKQKNTQNHDDQLDLHLMTRLRGTKQLQLIRKEFYTFGSACLLLSYYIAFITRFIS